MELDQSTLSITTIQTNHTSKERLFKYRLSMPLYERKKEVLMEALMMANSLCVFRIPKLFLDTLKMFFFHILPAS